MNDQNQKLPDLTDEDNARFEALIRVLLRDQQQVDLLDQLNGKDKEYLFGLLKSRLSGNLEEQRSLEQDAWDSVYLRKPVSVEEFIDSEFFVGKWYRENLYDCWKEEICNVINSGSIEWVLSGAIGIGKTSAAMLATMYKLYQVTCMRDPCGFYGCTNIVFGLFSVSLNLAQDVEANMLITRLKESEYFRQVVGVSEDAIGGRSARGTILRFPNNIKFSFGSQGSHALGQDVFSAIVDEIAFSKSVGAKQVRDLYNSVKTRLESRFMTNKGRVPGLLCIASSANTEGDFLDEHLKNSTLKDKVHISSFSLYQVKSYPGQRFRVLIGNKFHTSRLLDKVERKEDGRYKVIPIGGDIPDDVRVEEVPIAWYERYNEDLERSIRDISGIALYAASPFFGNRERLHSLIDSDRYHPFTVDEPTLSIKDDDMTLESIFKKEDVFEEIDSFRHTYQLKVNAGAPRFIHADLALMHDCVGLVCSHLYGFKKVERPDMQGVIQKTTLPVVYVDFMIKIKPPKGSEIDFAKITSFIFYLQKLGMPIGAVTFDKFQSNYHQQIFKKSGIESFEISMDRTPTAYQTLKAGFMAGCINYYMYRPLIDELTSLQVVHSKNSNRMKIDHPPNSGKDVADALAGSHYAVVTSKYTENQLSENMVLEEQLRKKNEPPPPTEPAAIIGTDWLMSDYDEADRITGIIGDKTNMQGW